MSSLYHRNFNLPPSRIIPSPHIRANSDIESQYLRVLLAERKMLGPFIQILPFCSLLLDQEILKICGGRINNQGFSGYGGPSRGFSSQVMLDIKGNYIGNLHGNAWNGIQQEILDGSQCMAINLHSVPGIPSVFIVKRVLRLDIPVERYPNFNFVGRLLGPRGNSLKRLEAATGCRVFIRGRGSIKDPQKEERLRGKRGYEHLNEPMHVMIEAELPASVVDLRLQQVKEIIEELLKPVDESQDMIKRQQLRELEMIREAGSRSRGSGSHFNHGGIKRSIPGWQ